MEDFGRGGGVSSSKVFTTTVPLPCALHKLRGSDEEEWRDTHVREQESVPRVRLVTSQTYIRRNKATEGKCNRRPGWYRVYPTPQLYPPSLLHLNDYTHHVLAARRSNKHFSPVGYIRKLLVKVCPTSVETTWENIGCDEPRIHSKFI